VIGGRRYRLGRADYALSRGESPANLEDAVVLADDDGAIAAFEVDERIRPGARAAIDALVREDIHVGLASGDAKSKAASAASSLGIADWAARQSPADKLAWVESLRATGARVAVVADGVNDAPMLAGADVSIAVGSAADAAQAASDIVITGQLGAVADARSLAREMLSILRQNRRWALGYNLAAVPLAALGFVSPWLAAVGMSASSLIVVLNAMRIGRASSAPVTRKEVPAAGEIGAGALAAGVLEAGVPVASEKFLQRRAST
jgi:Cu2+-exporting ATPase